MIKIIKLFNLIIILLSSNCILAQSKDSEVKIIGNMKDVMWNGKLIGNINLDTIKNKNNLFGIGPLENLKGEIIVIDGKSYTSTIANDTIIEVNENFKIKAPFFAYTNNNQWDEIKVPDTIQSISQFENYLINISKNIKNPFMFKINGMIDEAKIHVVNLPDGNIVSSPDEAHKGQLNKILINKDVEIIGFFSTKHKTIFTHHNTYLHMHLITIDRKIMGHLDEMTLNKGKVSLYIPKM